MKEMKQEWRRREGAARRDGDDVHDDQDDQDDQDDDGGRHTGGTALGVWGSHHRPTLCGHLGSMDGSISRWSLCASHHGSLCASAVAGGDISAVKEELQQGIRAGGDDISGVEGELERGSCALGGDIFGVKAELQQGSGSRCASGGDISGVKEELEQGFVGGDISSVKEELCCSEVRVLQPGTSEAKTKGAKKATKAEVRAPSLKRRKEKEEEEEEVTTTMRCRRARLAKALVKELGGGAAALP